jgi:hypothetical protein
MFQGRVTSLKEKLEQVSKSEAAWEHKFKMADTELTRAKQGNNRRFYVRYPTTGMFKNFLYGMVFQNEVGTNWRHIRSFVKYFDLCFYTVRYFLNKSTFTRKKA